MSTVQFKVISKAHRLLISQLNFDCDTGNPVFRLKHHKIEMQKAGPWDLLKLDIMDKMRVFCYNMLSELRIHCFVLVLAIDSLKFGKKVHF